MSDKTPEQMAEELLPATAKFKSISDGSEYYLNVLAVDCRPAVAAALGEKDAEIAALKADIERHIKITSEQAGELDRVQALPEQEWLAVGAILLQILAAAARDGYPVRETAAMAAIDRGNVYVSRLRAQLQAAEQRAREAEISALKWAAQQAYQAPYIGFTKTVGDIIADAINQRIRELEAEGGKACTSPPPSPIPNGTA